MHGERRRLLAALVAPCGSSPRTWGTRYLVGRHGAEERFIPTYMGNALTRPRTSGGNAVHPHVHGERSAACRFPHATGGSSPRTWGTRPCCRHGRYHDRFIPTYMGNALPRRPRSAPLPVHPHVHGERIGDPEFGVVAVGSSPRTWGTQWTRFYRRIVDRFIPTYMGNASYLSRSRNRSPVHPHVRGERSRKTNL